MRIPIPKRHQIEKLYNQICSYEDYAAADAFHSTTLLYCLPFPDADAVQSCGAEIYLGYRRWWYIAHWYYDPGADTWPKPTMSRAFYIDRLDNGTYQIQFMDEFEPVDTCR